MQHGEIVIYKADDNPDFQIEVRIEDETVWLNRQQMAVLFDRDIKTIGKHINNAIKEELKSIPVIAKFATTASDGKTYQVEHYNLDMILSVGYRVNDQKFDLLIKSNIEPKEGIFYDGQIFDAWEFVSKLIKSAKHSIILIIHVFSRAHDRFLIIDEETIYHIGASLKDLGKKWFAFSRIELDAEEMLAKLN